MPFQNVLLTTGEPLEPRPPESTEFYAATLYHPSGHSDIPNPISRKDDIPPAQ